MATGGFFSPLFVNNLMTINRSFLATLALFLFSVAALGQSTAPALKAYYGLKNALVATDGAKAKAQALTLANTLGNVKAATLKTDGKKALASARNSARVISRTGDVAAQRKEFSTLSTSMIALARPPGQPKPTCNIARW